MKNPLLIRRIACKYFEILSNDKILHFGSKICAAGFRNHVQNDVYYPQKGEKKDFPREMFHLRRNIPYIFFLFLNPSVYLQPTHKANLLHVLFCGIFCRKIVELLLTNEASANIVDVKGSSPLHLAAWSGNVDIVRMLLCHGPSIPNVNLMVRKVFLIIFHLVIRDRRTYVASFLSSSPASLILIPMV